MGVIICNDAKLFIDGKEVSISDFKLDSEWLPDELKNEQIKTGENLTFEIKIDKKSYKRLVRMFAAMYIKIAFCTLFIHIKRFFTGK